LKVLIVDDEPVIRTGLRLLIDWGIHGFELYGEAADGIEAWDMLRSGEVDILVTDILMPRMDGLELVRMARQEELDLSVIVLSCLDDFSCVKEAMKLGAKDYILKPTMEPDELLKVLKETRTELSARREEERKKREWQDELQQSKHAQRALSLEQFVASGEPDPLLKQWISEVGRVSSMGIFIRKGTDAARLRWDLGALDEHEAAVKLDEQLVVLFYRPQFRASQHQSHAERYEKRLRLDRFMQQMGMKGEDYYIEIGMDVLALPDILTAGELHKRQAEHFFYTYPNRIDSLESAPVRNPEAKLPHVERTDMLRAVASGNDAAVKEALMKVCRELAASRPPLAKLYSFVFELLGLASSHVREHRDHGMDDYEARFVTLERIQSHMNLSELTRFVHEALDELMVLRYLEPGEQGTRNPFVRKALQYIRDNYRNNITTLDISEHVKLSRSYLSDLYSKEMGESLSETLLRVRMDEAKRLLEMNEWKIYEIAEAVGFHDVKTFTKTFKRLFGCSPKEYGTG
jgi:two-component system, response regulator YesN